MKNKVVIFGAWQEGIELFFEIRQLVEVVAFIDNNPNLQSKEIYGISIISPEDLKKIEYDEIFISSSKRYQEMLIQLRAMGVNREKIKIVFGFNKIKEELNVTKCYLDENINDYEKRWADLRRKYKEILIYMLDVSCIGEMVGRLWKMIEDETLIDKNVLRVFLPTIGDKGRICNKELFELARLKLNIASEELDFWEYILNIHKNEVGIIDYNKYLYRDELIPCVIKRDYVYFTFRQSQIEIGKKRLAEMGICGEYVCLASRSSNYAQSTLKDKDQMRSNIEIHEYRNSDFYDYQETIDYLQTINLQTVRMGRGEKPIKSINNCIDYAGLYADDFMDIFLMANCKFAVVGGGSGIFSLANSFGRPVLFVNLIPITFGSGGENYCEADLYIPKKVFSIIKERYLSLLEMTDLEHECLVDGRKYREKGIEFIDNSPEEILEAVKELLARMNGQWIETEEEMRLYSRYLSIFSHMENDSKNNIYNWVGGPMPRKLSVNYLKKNLYLLE